MSEVTEAEAPTDADTSPEPDEAFMKVTAYADDRAPIFQTGTVAADGTIDLDGTEAITLTPREALDLVRWALKVKERAALTALEALFSQDN